MRVFVTGATGYVGTAVTEALRGAGHDVVGLARSDAAEATLRAAGHEVHRGDLLDLDSLREGARAADGVVHAGLAPLWHDMDAFAAAERNAARAMIEVLGEVSGSPRPFLFTSGSGVLGVTGTELANEDRPADPYPPLAWRLPIENEVLAAGKRDAGRVATAVFRVPIIHGRGGNPVTLDLLDQARRNGEARHVGSGENHWSAVDVDDLADLYRLALEALADGRVEPGTLFHVAAEPTFSMRDLAQAIATGTGVGRTGTWTVDEANAATPYPFAELFASEQRLDASRARRLLGWSPRRPHILEDIAHGSYAGGDR